MLKKIFGLMIVFVFLFNVFVISGQIETEAQESVDEWKALTEQGKLELFKVILSPDARLDLFRNLGDLAPEEQYNLWIKLTNEEKVTLWKDMNNPGLSPYIVNIKKKFWQNLGMYNEGKEERNNIWFDPEFGLDDGLKNEIFHSIDSKEEQRKMLEDIINSEHNKKLLRGKGVSDFNLKVEISDDVDMGYVNFESGLVKTRSHLYREGAFFSVDDSYYFMNPNIDSIKIEGEGRVSFGEKDSERKVVLDIGTIDAEGFFDSDLENKYGFTKGFINVNVLEGDIGTVSVDEKGLFSLNEGGRVKIGDNVYKQFYSKNGMVSKWYNSGSEDSAGVLDIGLEGYIKDPGVERESGSPADLIDLIVPKIKNMAIEISDGKKILGDAYFSRVVFTDFHHNTPGYVPDSVYDKAFSIQTDENGKLSVDMLSDNYIAFIAKPGVDVTSLTMGGSGGIAEDGKGRFLYFRNGKLGITVDNKETHISGKVTGIDVNINNVRNSESNKNFKVEKTASGNRLVGGTINTPVIWGKKGCVLSKASTIPKKQETEKDNRLVQINEQMATIKSKVTQQTQKVQAVSKKSTFGTKKPYYRTASRSSCSNGGCYGW